jgi:NRPS condensation-like uncharacterized protein
VKEVVVISNSEKNYKVESWDLLQYLFQNFNDHTLHFMAQLDGHIDVNRLKKAVTLSGESFPLIACKFVEGKGHPVWREAGLSADDMVKVNETDNSKSAIQSSLCVMSDTLNGPQLKINVVRDGISDTLCFTMNHMLCDAAGFKDYLYLLCDIYTKLSEDSGYRNNYICGSRNSVQMLKPFGTLEKIDILFKKYDISKHDSGAAFGLDGQKNNPFILAHTISRERFLSVKAYAKKHNVTVNDVMLTAFLRVVYSFLGRTVAVPCTVDLRKYLPDRSAVGICNLVSYLICDIGSDLGDDFADTLFKVKRVMDSEKDNQRCLKSMLLLEIAYKLFPYKIAKSLITKEFKNPPISFTNLGILNKDKLRFSGTNVVSSYMNGSIKYARYFQLALSTFDNEVTLSINFCGTQTDKKKISLFLKNVDLELPMY